MQPSTCTSSTSSISSAPNTSPNCVRIRIAICAAGPNSPFNSFSSRSLSFIKCHSPLVSRLSPLVSRSLVLLHCALRIVHCPLCIVHCPLHIPHLGMMWILPQSPCLAYTMPRLKTCNTYSSPLTVTVNSSVCWSCKPCALAKFHNAAPLFTGIHGTDLAFCRIAVGTSCGGGGGGGG